MANQETYEELAANPTVEIGAGFKFRTRNGEMRYSIFMMKDDPELCRLLINLGSDNRPMERFQDVPRYLLNRLLELGVIIPTSGELGINPTVEIGAGCRLRTRSGGPREKIIMMNDDPEFCRLLINLGSDDRLMERFQDIPRHLLNRLIELGAIIPKSEILDEMYFYCMLDHPPLDLIPFKYGSLRGPDRDYTEFVLNRKIHMQIGSDPPVHIADRIPFCDQFRHSDGIIWVEDPGTGVLAPYWLRAQFMEIIQRLIAGQIPPSDLPTRVRETLAHINVLVPRSYEEVRIKEWQRIYERLSAQLRSEQYVSIRNILHPLQLSALRYYFRALDQKEYLIKDTYHGNNRYVWQNDGVARFVHHQITGLVNRVVPAPIKPSYSMLAIYKSGAILTKHIDRPQCAWNLSLLIDADPEVELSDSWPIHFEIEGRVKEARLNIGDGVLYRGTDTPHWRDALPEGRIVTLILCHFVPVDFSDSLY